MTRPRIAEPIREITLASGRVRYLATLDVGKDPATGKRLQRKQKFDTLKAARAWLAETRTAVMRGTYADRSTVTLAEHLDAWLAGRLNIRPSTRRSYADVLRPFRDRLGAVPVGDVTRRQVEQVRDALLSGEARRVGVKGRPLAPRSVRLALQTLEAAMTAAVRDGLAVRNPVEHVERPSGQSAPGAAWDVEQARAFLRVAAGDRLHAAWLLSLHGLRRGEVVGLPWSAVDLDAGTLSVAQARVAVAGEVLLSGTKTARGTRVLPLPDDLAAALRALRARQAAERLAAGPAYVGEGYVVCDDKGRAMRPEAYSDSFRALAARAGVPVIRLHDLRHTSVSLKRSAGWPDHLVAAWHGHDESVMRRTYSHVYMDDLRAHARTLAGGL